MSPDRVVPERTPEGLEIRLRPHGVARYISSVFLSIWLCGWAVGEGVALFALFGGGYALLAGRRMFAGMELPPSPAAIMGALFLLFWLTFWTWGGVMAMRELLRSLWSEDRVIARGDALVVHRRLGPFRSTTTIPRGDLIRIYGIDRRRRLMAETTHGRVPLTAMAPWRQSESLAAALSQDLGLPATADAGASLPERWSEAIDAEGATALVKDAGGRSVQARIASVMTALFAAVALVLVRQAREQAGLWPPAGIMVALTAGLGFGWWRLARTRLEWRIEPGKIRLRRRSDRGVADIFEGASLELVESSDSDGDTWFTLNAVAAEAPPAGGVVRLADRKWRRTIERSRDDPAIPRRLGLWLAGRAGLTLDDRATPEAREREQRELFARLEASGRLGQWLARHLPRPDKERPGGA